MKSEKKALLGIALLFVFFVAFNGCLGEKTQETPTPTPSTPTPTKTLQPTPTPQPTVKETPQPSIEPTLAPTPTPVSETIVLDGRKNYSGLLKGDENTAFQIALTKKSLKLFLMLDEIEEKYMPPHFDYFEKRGCSVKKRENIARFVDGRKITISKKEGSIFEIKIMHPLIYKSERLESLQKDGKIIRVDTKEKKIVYSSFYEPYNGLLLYYVFTVEDYITIGFDEYLFGTGNYDYLAKKFVEKFCELDDKNFKE
ncbi:MAG: PT domain-containing protein [Candidatus Diapherotrites archaeon]